MCIRDSYYAQTLAENAGQALDLLCDIVLNPRLDIADVELERGVILEEMSMYEDSGEEVAHDALCAAIWPGSPLGRPITGTRETVAALSADDLREYRRTHYAPGRMLAVAAGRFDPVSYTHLDVYKRQGGEGVDAGQVHDDDIVVLFQPPFLFLYRNAGPVAHELIGAGKRVEQGRFSAVGIARQGDFLLFEMCIRDRRWPGLRGVLPPRDGVRPDTAEKRHPSGALAGRKGVAAHLAPGFPRRAVLPLLSVSGRERDAAY